MSETSVQDTPQVIDSTAEVVAEPSADPAPRRGRVRKVAHAVTEQATKVAHVVTEQGGKVAHAVTEQATKVAEVVTGRGSKVAHAVTEQGGKVAHAVAEQSSKVAHAVTEQGGKVAEQAGKMAGAVGARIGLPVVDAAHTARLMEVVATAGQPDVALGLLDGDAFLAWLTSLSEDERTALYRNVAAFCSHEGVDLEWLLSEPGVPDAEVQAAMVRAVQLYAMAQHQAARVASAMAGLQAYRAWQKAPTSREHWPMTQKLYLKLSEMDAVSPPSAATLLMDEGERQAYIAQVVEGAAASHLDVVMDVLKGR